MGFKERLHRALASRAEIEADEERSRAAGARGCTPVSDLRDRARATVSGVLRSVTLRPREGVPALQAELFDGSGTLDLVWLGRREIHGVEPGRRLRAEGLVCLVDGRRTVFNPRYELAPRPGD
jgi:hypothetical protein